MMEKMKGKAPRYEPKKCDNWKTQFGDDQVTPLAGKVIAVSVKKGDMVLKEQQLAVIEAMKMENEIRATHAGIVQEVFVARGNQVRANEVIATVILESKGVEIQ